MLVSVTASVSKPDLAAAQLHDNTCNPAAQLGICGTLGHWMMKTNAPHPYAISKALALRHLHRPHRQAADSVATPSSSGNQAATGTLACLSTSSFSRSLAAPTSSSTFSPFFQTWRSGLRQVRTAPRRPPRQRLPSAAQAWLTQRRAGQGAHLERGHRADASFGRHSLRQSPRGALVGCHSTYPRVCLQRLLRQHPRRLLQSIEGHAAQRAGEHAPQQRPRPP